jgi:hypothetical protein
VNAATTSWRAALVAVALLGALGGCASSPAAEGRLDTAERASTPAPAAHPAEVTSPPETTTTTAEAPTTTTKPAPTTTAAPPPPPPPTTAPAPPPTVRPLAAAPPTTAAAVSRQGDCAPAYPDDCLPPAPDLDCPDIRHKVRVDHAFGDPHRLDADGDGWGCESYG